MASRILPLVFLCLLGAGASPAPLWGQDGDPPNIKKTKDLKFKDVIAGATHVKDPLDKDAGEFEVRGDEGAEVLITFILPFELVGPGGSTVPIYFGDADAILSSEKNAPESGLRFDPRIPITYIGEGNKGKAYIWLGATVTPPFSSRAGGYEGIIVIEASYTGS